MLKKREKDQYLNKIKNKKKIIKNKRVIININIKN